MYGQLATRSRVPSNHASVLAISHVHLLIFLKPDSGDQV